MEQQQLHLSDLNMREDLHRDNIRPIDSVRIWVEMGMVYIQCI